MQLETLAALKTQWRRCSVTVQRSLIRQYLEYPDRDDLREQGWLEYLAREFGLSDAPSSECHHGCPPDQLDSDH